MLGMIVGPDGIFVIVAVALVLVFGGSRIPRLARGIGSASREFKLGSHSDVDSSERSHVPIATTGADPSKIPAQTPQVARRS